MNSLTSFSGKNKIRNLILVLLIISLTINCRDNSHKEIKTESVVLDSLNKLQPCINHDSIIIISDFQDYQKIDDLINCTEFLGSVLYFDIWSTNCGPCLKEFQVSKELKERYKNQAVKFVYLVDTRDTPESLARWDSLINRFELYGYHMRMSNKFYYSINAISGIKFFGKPHYILVDKEGKIVYPNAERPSSGEKLYSQIDTLL